MARYRYRAIDQTGHVITGVLAAPGEAAVEGQLRAQGQWLVEVKPVRAFAAFSARRSRVSRRQLIDFAVHMQSMLAGGVSVFDALRSMATHTPHAYFKDVIESVCRAVESGSPLHEAMANHSTVFPPHVTTLIQAGEESGTLPDTFRDLHRYLEWLDRMVGDIRQATVYPLVVIVAVLLFLLLLFTFVIPRFVPILENLQVPLPAVTRLMVSISDALTSTWWVWGGVLFGGPLVLWVAVRRNERIAQWLDAWKLRLPFMGALLRSIAIARFARNFGILYRAGIPPLRCFTLCSGLVGNRVVREALEQAKRAVAEGSSLSEALGRHQIFPAMVLQMIAVGEASGNLDEALETVATYYNEEIPRRVKQLFSVLEPLVTLVLIGIVGLVALAMFMPLMSIMGGMT